MTPSPIGLAIVVVGIIVAVCVIVSLAARHWEDETCENFDPTGVPAESN
jgi:hypothetical protein